MELNQPEKEKAVTKEAQKRLAKEALSIFKEPLQGIVGKQLNRVIHFNFNF